MKFTWDFVELSNEHFPYYCEGKMEMSVVVTPHRNMAGKRSYDHFDYLNLYTVPDIMDLTAKQSRFYMSVNYDQCIKCTSAQLCRRK